MEETPPAPLPFRQALRLSLWEVSQLSLAIHGLDWFLPLPDAVFVACYLGGASLLVWQQSYVQRTLPGLWRDIPLDRPALSRSRPGWCNDAFSLLPSAAAYLVAISLGGVVFGATRRCMRWIIVFALKMAATEAVPFVERAIWRRDPLSVALAMLPFLVRDCWFWGVLACCRRWYLAWAKSSALRLRGGMTVGSGGSRCYRYEAVTSERYFRLLKLEPGFWGLRCSLVVCSLDGELPSYDAMSYRWGSSEKTHTISIGGQDLSIPASAFEILWDRASHWRTRWLWVDAICIDQEDADDKTRQVRLMRDIYGKAARTIVWLGDAPDSSIAWVFVTQIYQEYLNVIDPDKAVFTGLFKTNDVNPKWRALARMLENPYWSRVWVVQEIVAARQVHIRYGRWWFDWDLFAPVMSQLRNKGRGSLLERLDLSEGMATPSYEGIHRLQLIAELRQRFRDGEKKTLPVIVADFSSSQATVDIDHVYAFQGVSSAADEGAVLPDYRKGALDVFRDLTLYSLSQERIEPSLAMLAVAGVANTRDGTGENWPSWVPDLQRISSRKNHLSAPLHVLATYEAGGALVPTIGTSHTQDEIVVKGVLLDELAAVTRLPVVDMASWKGIGEPGSAEEKAAVELNLLIVGRVREAQRLAESSCADVYFNGQSRWEAFWRTQIGDRCTESSPAGASYGDHLEHFLQITEKYTAAMNSGDYKQAFAPADLLAEVAASSSNSKADTRPASAETTFRALEQMIPLPEELGNIRDFLTPDLLDSPSRLFEELVAITDLPRWASTELRRFVVNRLGTPQQPTDSEEFKATPQLRNALEELAVRCTHGTLLDDKAPQRVYLFLALMLGGSHLNLSDAQLGAVKEIIKFNQQGTEASKEKQMGSLLGAASAFRRFGVTRRGYMALVPADAETGDVVAVFVGAKVPYALRKSAGAAASKYRLVGEAYLHGFMHGEALARPAEDVHLV